MTESPILRNRFRPLTLAATMVAAAMLLSGCTGLGSGTDPAPSTPGSTQSDGSGSGTGTDTAQDDVGSSTSGGHQARLTMTGIAYDFTPTTCEIGDKMVRVSGLGVADEALRADGPGVDVNDPNDHTNHPLFLDIDISEVDGWPAGKVFLYAFADKAAPTDSYIEAEIGGGDDYSMGDVLNGYELEVQFKHPDGEPVDTGTVMIRCA